ncbi:MAG: hydroxyacid dehydrogenase [Nanoarchaeota archaeon]
MKIAFFETEFWEQEYLEEKLKEHELQFFEEDLNEKNAEQVKDADIISIFIYSQINKQLLSKLKNLKMIATRSTGVDHIDLKECKKRKIKILNVPSYGENTVAEHTFALILSLARKIPQSFNRTTKGDFTIDNLQGFDLKGKTLGIIGLGRIGYHSAKIAKGFEMKILVFDLKRKRKLEKSLGFKYAQLDYLLKNSDIVTIHCPYNKHTHHLINKKNIKLMKRNSYLINTARGPIVDTEALIESLLKNRIAGAGLDVLEEEELIKEETQLLSRKFSRHKLEGLLENHILATIPNVIITPHNAFNTKEALQRILDVTTLNIKESRNKKPKNLVK